MSRSQGPLRFEKLFCRPRKMEIKVAKRRAKFSFSFVCAIVIVIVITIFRLVSVLYGNFFAAATSSGSRWRIRNKLRPRHVACQKKLCRRDAMRGIWVSEGWDRPL